MSGAGRFPAAAGGSGEQPSPSEHSWLDPGRISLLHWHIPLGLPEPPARPAPETPRCLARRHLIAEAEPAGHPAGDASGKTFRQGPSVVRIEKDPARRRAIPRGTFS